MLVTLYPPSVDGIVIAPVVDVEIARLELDPPPNDALPLLTLYVHSMPSTTSVSAHTRPTAQKAVMSAISRTVKAILVFIVVSPNFATWPLCNINAHGHGSAGTPI